MDFDNRTRNVDVSQLCRICALQDEHLIPIFEGDGLDLDFEVKLKTYLSLIVSKDDTLPLHICLKCSNTLLGWHELVTAYKDADQRLRSMLLEKDNEPMEQDDIVYLDDDSHDSVEIIDSCSIAIDSPAEITVLEPSTSDVNPPPHLDDTSKGAVDKPASKGAVDKATSPNSNRTTKSRDSEFATIIPSPQLPAKKTSAKNPESPNKPSTPPIVLLRPGQKIKTIVKPFLLSRQGTSASPVKNPPPTPVAKPAQPPPVVEPSPTPKPVKKLILPAPTATQPSPTAKPAPKPGVKLTLPAPTATPPSPAVKPSSAPQGNQPKILTLVIPTTMFPQGTMNPVINIPILGSSNNPNTTGKAQSLGSFVMPSGVPNVVSNILPNVLPNVGNNSNSIFLVKTVNGQPIPQDPPTLIDLVDLTDSTNSTPLVRRVATAGNKTITKGALQETNKNTEEEPIYVISHEDHRYSKSAKVVKGNSSQKENVDTVSNLIAALNQKSMKRGCFVCGKVIHNKTLLFSHERSHFKSSDSLSFNCALCRKSFDTFDGMMTHRKEHGKSEKRKRIRVRPTKKTKAVKLKVGRTRKVPVKRAAGDSSGMDGGNDENSAPKPKPKPKTKKDPKAINDNIKCYICRQCFPNKILLMAHKLTHSEEEWLTAYKCTICGKGFKDSGALRTHEKTHEDGPGFLCAECGKVFKQRSTLNQHVRKHHDVPNPWPQHHCDQCPKTFDSRHKLEQHLNTHTGDRPYACDKCDKAFHTSSNLRQHVACHFEVRPCMCDVCGKTFKWPKNLKQHTFTHVSKELRPKTGAYGRTYNREPIECDLCNKILRGRFSLKAHRYKFHREQFFLENPEEQRFPCPHCEGIYTTDMNLKVHIERFHTNEKPPDPRLPRPPRFQCHICGKRYTTKINRDDHIRIHTGERPYACQHCPKTFTCSSNLHAHQDAHRLDRPHACTYCNKQFKRKAHLDIHIRTHTGEKPYVCDVCGRGFAQSNDKKKHRTTHFDERPYQCSFCENTFKKKSDLLRHLSKHCASERQEDPDDEQEIDYSAILPSSEGEQIIAYELC